MGLSCWCDSQGSYLIDRYGFDFRKLRAKYVETADEDLGEVDSLKETDKAFKAMRSRLSTPLI